MQFFFNLPCGQPTHCTHWRFCLPCGHGVQVAHAYRNLSCGHFLRPSMTATAAAVPSTPHLRARGNGGFASQNRDLDICS